MQRTMWLSIPSGPICTQVPTCRKGESGLLTKAVIRQGARPARGERREPHSSTQLGHDGESARGRPGLLHRVLGQSHPERMEQSELAKGGRKGLCLGDMRELAVPRSDQAKPAPTPPCRHIPEGVQPQVGGLGCLTARVPPSLSFSESVDHL